MNKIILRGSFDNESSIFPKLGSPLIRIVLYFSILRYLYNARSCVGDTLHDIGVLYL